MVIFHCYVSSPEGNHMISQYTPSDGYFPVICVINKKTTHWNAPAKDVMGISWDLDKKWINVTRGMVGWNYQHIMEIEIGSDF